MASPLLGLTEAQCQARYLAWLLPPLTGVQLLNQLINDQYNALLDAISPTDPFLPLLKGKWR